MTVKINNELNFIIKTIVDTGIVSKIILFGSLARGEENSESDIDLCVLTPLTDRRPIDISIELRRRLFNVNSPFDIVTYNQDRFAEHAAEQTTFAHLINKEGVIVYER